MLAYELYLGSKDSDEAQVSKQFPLKKVFYNRGKIEIDSTTLQEYGCVPSGDSKPMQDSLQMPLSTTNRDDLNLPWHVTGSSSLRPYIEIYGACKGNAASLKIELGIKKPGQVTGVLDTNTGEITMQEEGTIVLRLDKKQYLQNSGTLFDEYVKSGIIDDAQSLDMEACKKIMRAFFEFAKGREIGTKKTTFRVYVLPNRDKIVFKNKDSKAPKEPFVDYFGNEARGYPSSTTQNAKFLSYDDRAFTIQCEQKEAFYRNLGIGDESFEKIAVRTSNTFAISGLEWTFMDLEGGFEFKRTNKGILHQLHANYRDLKSRGSGLHGVQMKIICHKKSSGRASHEIMLSENVTMDKMDALFRHMDNVPASGLEILIENGRNPVWDTYLYAVRSFLAGNKMDKDRLLNFFNRMLKRQTPEWPKAEPKPEDFFTRADFCMRTLINARSAQDAVDRNEEFAVKIGQAAKAYVAFKQRNREQNNSSLDILTYSKYDREKLRFVLSRIGRGIQLSKASDDQKKSINDEIGSLQPREEIEDEVATKDYSYFFFKGYYTGGKSGDY